MMTRQNLLLLPPVKLPAARKTLSSTLVIHPLYQVWNHPGTLVSCLIQPVVLMIMWTKFAKNNYQLYSIGKIRKHLDQPTTEKMINSAVISRLDYCSSLLYGINGYLVSQLQRCQNNAARIVSLRRKYDHITPVLKDLHWLPVEYRTNYKIVLLAYKAQHGMAPPYLSSLLSPYKPGRSLRSEGKHLLTTPRYRLEGFGMPPLLSGTRSLSPSSVPSPLTFSRAIWRHICLISHIHNCDATFLSYCVFSPSFCLVSVWYH